MDALGPQVLWGWGGGGGERAIYIRRLSVDWQIYQTTAKWFFRFYSVAKNS